jgi:hypothetical protein
MRIIYELTDEELLARLRCEGYECDGIDESCIQELRERLEHYRDHLHGAPKPDTCDMCWLKADSEDELEEHRHKK